MRWAVLVLSLMLAACSNNPSPPPPILVGPQPGDYPPVTPGTGTPRPSITFEQFQMEVAAQVQTFCIREAMLTHQILAAMHLDQVFLLNWTYMSPPDRERWTRNNICKQAYRYRR